jgi:hypothetical protein
MRSPASGFAINASWSLAYSASLRYSRTRRENSFVSMKLNIDLLYGSAVWHQGGAEFGV